MATSLLEVHPQLACHVAKVLPLLLLLLPLLLLLLTSTNVLALGAAAAYAGVCRLQLLAYAALSE
jgi:hypothetical protein